MEREETEARQDWGKVVSPTYNRTAALMDPQQLRLPTQNLQKIKPVTISAQREKKSHTSLPGARKLLTIDGCRNGKSQFELMLVGPW